VNGRVSGPGVAEGLEYDDGLIACSPDELVIRRYGPLLGQKRIPYAEIREVREFELNAARRWRLWGTTDPRRWFNLDLGRRHKRVAFLIDLGKRVSPVITPDDPQRVAAVLRPHGVEVRDR
jgi:hypothetical protein